MNSKNPSLTSSVVVRVARYDLEFYVVLNPRTRTARTFWSREMASTICTIENQLGGQNK